tara:strand:- start:449 stop:610 length:162 start_codon:yes stop_codon:yes gene_type:complete
MKALSSLKRFARECRHSHPGVYANVAFPVGSGQREAVPRFPLRCENSTFSESY